MSATQDYQQASGIASVLQKVFRILLCFKEERPLEKASSFPLRPCTMAVSWTPRRRAFLFTLDYDRASDGQESSQPNWID